MGTRVTSFLLCLTFGSGLTITAGTPKPDNKNLTKFLLGKEVKALIEMPAYKDGIDVYYTPRSDKRMDDRGIDYQALTKWLKAKGVGVDKGEIATITDVKVDSDRIEIHFDGGGEGRRGSKHANKVNAGYKRAGGSRINFRYGRKLTDEDVRVENFLRFMSRVADTSAIEMQSEARLMPAAYRQAIDSHSVVEGMNYEMVLLSFGEPEQKKVDTAAGGESDFKETWYYLKNGHRYVLRFANGKVTSVQKF